MHTSTHTITFEVYSLHTCTTAHLDALGKPLLIASCGCSLKALSLKHMLAVSSSVQHSTNAAIDTVITIKHSG
jgi:hypothetical protein